MQDTSGTEETAVTPSDALAALEQDRVVDLTASMKLATGSLNPPQTASSLTLSDDGSTGQAKVRTARTVATQNCYTGAAVLCLLVQPASCMASICWAISCHMCVKCLCGLKLAGLLSGVHGDELGCRCSQMLSGLSITSAQDPSQLRP